MDAIKAELAQDEVARARAVWRRKIRRRGGGRGQHAKQVRFLLQRGFSQQAIRAAMRKGSDDD